MNNNNNNEFNIFWIRHAESCANFLEYKILDKPEDENTLKELIRKINNTDGLNLLNKSSDNENSEYKTLIETQYSKLDHIITPKNKLSKTTNECNKPYDKVILYGNDNQETCWEKIKKEMANYVKNSMYKSAWLIEPTLSSVGILQSLNLAKKFDEMDIKTSPNYYISSSMIRTVMTALLCMTMCKTKKSNTIYVVPYINEHTNWAYETIEYDKQNMGNSSKELEDKIELMKKWITDNIGNFLQYIDPDPENQNKNDFIKNMNAIKIDYSILEHFELEDKNYRMDNLNKFKTEVLPMLFKEINPNQTKNIAAFSHGYFIKKIYEIFNKNNKEKTNKSITNEPKILFHASISQESLTLTITNDTTTTTTTTNIEYLHNDKTAIYFRKKNSNTNSNKNSKPIYTDTIDNNICSIKSLYGIVNRISPGSISLQTGGRIKKINKKSKKINKKSKKINKKSKKTKKTKFFLKT